MKVQLRSIAETEAAVGWADGHTVIVDRPDGRAGGMGLGFNGAQLLALAAGGCFCNDLRYVAHEMGATMGDVKVDVQVDLEGEPLLATRISMSVTCDVLDGTDPRTIVAKARQSCMVSNSLAKGILVNVLYS
ncbi:MAG: OsmC family protein [Burkholderiaceae bacterium]